MWNRVMDLEGFTLHTSGRNKPFNIIEVTDQKCVIKVESTGKLRSIQRKEFEDALKIGEISSLNTSVLRQKGASEANPAYVMAILRYIN